MNITGTGVAVGAAVVIALAFLFFGPEILAPFSAQSSQPASTMTDQNADMSASTTPDTASVAAPTTLQVNDLKVGTGATLEPGDTVTMSYVGALQDGTVFDSTDAHGGTPLTLVVAADGSLHTQDGGGLIPGWSQGVAGMKEGGQRVLIIPPSLGYGAQAYGPIPANSTLIFEINLLKVEAPK